MKKITTLFTLSFLLLISSSTVYGQGFLWGREATPQSSKVGAGEILSDHSIAVDNKGNIYAFGLFLGQIWFGKDTLTTGKLGPQDLFLTKYNGAGNEIWTKPIKVSQAGLHTPMSVTVDDSGNAYVTGLYTDTLSFGKITLVYNGSENAFIAKYYANGNVAWAKQFNTISIFAFADGVSLATDYSGNIYLAGDYNDSVSFESDTLPSSFQSENFFLAKLNNNGNVQWIKTGNTFSNLSYCYAQSVAVDRLGNAYITGAFEDSISIGKDTVYTKTHNGNLFVAKYNPAGNVLWAASATAKNNVSQSVPSSISVDRYGDAYITGSFNDTISFGSDRLTETRLKYNVFLAKFAGSNGKVRWGIQGKNTGNTLWHGNSISSDTLASGGGFVLIEGEGTPYQMIFGNDTSKSNTPYSSADVILQFDSSGKVQCSSIFTEGGENDGDAVATGRSGEYIYVGGDVIDTSVFGPDTLVYGYNVDMPFIARWQPCNNNTSQGVNEVKTGIEKISVFPNPFRNYTTVVVSTEGKHYLELYDITGKKLQGLEFTGKQYELSSQGLAQGMYFIRVLEGINTLIGTSKIVVQ